MSRHHSELHRVVTRMRKRMDERGILYSETNEAMLVALAVCDDEISSTPADLRTAIEKMRATVMYKYPITIPTYVCEFQDLEKEMFAKCGPIAGMEGDSREYWDVATVVYLDPTSTFSERAGALVRYGIELGHAQAKTLYRTLGKSK